MFDRYTEKARRVIFFARYEASQLGCLHIETEHLLLGLLREDEELAELFRQAPGGIEAVRSRIEAQYSAREKVPASVDMPLSSGSKRVLAYAIEVADGLNHQHVGLKHLRLALLREETCLAAVILRERGPG